MADENLIRRVADEMDIRNIISKLAVLGDTGDLKDYEKLIHDDVHWEMVVASGPAPFAPVKGRAAMVAAGAKRRADGISGPGTHKYHCVDTTAVTINGDHAHSKSYLLFVKNGDATPELVLFKIYRDEFKRTKDGWKLSARYIEPG